MTRNVKVWEDTPSVDDTQCFQEIRDDKPLEEIKIGGHADEEMDCNLDQGSSLLNERPSSSIVSDHSFGKQRVDYSQSSIPDG